MNQRLRLFRVNKQGIVCTILLFVSGVLLGLSSGGFIVNFNQLGFSLMSGVQKGAYAVSSAVGGTFAAIRELAVLQQEYDELTRKVENYEFLQRSNAEIRKENERLKEQLGFSQSQTQRNIPAQIIGRDPNSLYSGITIDKGTAQGIKKNMPVIAFQNGNTGLVGKIVEVGFTTSMIMPLYDFECYVSTRIEHTRDLGIVNGQGAGFSLLMRYVKKRVFDELQYGDVVVTSGENLNYAKDVPVGTITRIRALDYDTSLEIELSPIIDFDRLETVMVLDMTQPGQASAEAGL
ncbi:MAG: rod shape-determining protein MreC [Spirochaetaceae bacterium]|jgi:rod shape-determining protein MreC|nr:rod shape-determining protein MreC [Spirochaetaceae bacterium]